MDVLTPTEINYKDPDCFDTIVQDFYKIVLNIGFKFTLNREDSEDIAQEVFIEINRSLSTFKGDSKLSTWIYRIAVTKSIDLIRKKNRKKRFAPIIDLFKLNQSGKEIPSKDRGPHNKMETEERKKTLSEAISSLPDNQKAAITLSKLDGLKNKEVADILGVSVSSVEALIHRGKQNLRKKLENSYINQLKSKNKFMFFVLFVITIFILQKINKNTEETQGFKNKNVKYFGETYRDHGKEK